MKTLDIVVLVLSILTVTLCVALILLAAIWGIVEPITGIIVVCLTLICFVLHQISCYHFEKSLEDKEE